MPRVVLVSVAVPDGERGLAERLSLAAMATGCLRSPRLRAMLRLVTDLTPAPVMTGVLKAFSAPAHSAALASNLHLRTRPNCLGAPVTRIVPVMWAPLGIPVAALLLGYDDTATVGFALDPAMPGLGDLPRPWISAVEVLV